jgi:hypothetical protein
MQFIDDEFIIVIDEPYTTYHLVFDLDQDLLVVHNTSSSNRINSADLIEYKPPSLCRKRKLNQLDDDILHDVRRLFK